MILNTILLLTSANLPTAAAEEQPEMIVVTSSRQAQSLTNLAESVTVLNEQLIKDVSPGILLNYLIGCRESMLMI
ncbi:MAG: hypothetical protein PHE38_13385 [Alishewanella agri]|nr:hypothetical protein [Alishewanella agri]